MARSEVRSTPSKVNGWTKSKYWSVIRSSLRSGMRFYPPKVEVLKDAKTAVPNATGTRKWQYKCASCGGQFKMTEVQVDHIEPAGSLLDYRDLPVFVEKLFCGKEGLQVLCKTCHKAKSMEERKSGKYKQDEV